VSIEVFKPLLLGEWIEYKPNPSKFWEGLGKLSYTKALVRTRNWNSIWL